MHQDFSGTENRILGALARPDDFLFNPLIQRHSETTPVTSRNAYSTNQRTNEEDTRVIFIPNRASLRAEWPKILARKRHTTAAHCRINIINRTLLSPEIFFTKQTFFKTRVQRQKTFKKQKAIKVDKMRQVANLQRKTKILEEECSGKSTKFCSFLNKIYRYTRMLKLCLEPANRSKFIRGRENCWKCWRSFRFLPVAYWEAKIPAKK